MKKNYQFVEIENLKINLNSLEFFKVNNLLSFEKLWSLPNSYFYYNKRYRTIEAYQLDNLRFYIKKYEDHLKEAETEWKNLIFLWKMGFPTLEPWIFGKTKNKALIVTEELPYPSLLKLLKEKSIQTEIIFLKFSKFLACFHEHNLFHQDCYLGHFYYDIKQDVFYIMDVARVKHNPMLKIKYLIKDLAQIQYSFIELFQEKTLYWWKFFWKEYNKNRKKKLNNLIQFLINKKSLLIQKHTQKVIKRGGEKVITYYSDNHL
ncbi:MAG: hypothetical protein NZ530_00715 [Thermodesulfobacteriaceae bacterium]|nr:hypothetical protein [Thermodesulfobacteriaceae bacterium]MCX8040880.1 hypothetical protein [Thermodesulfobacteriaceae bacterium]MDW8135217.1 lipopolysaccharide kinase InaA family protein [Thermodesulfobacterium sp.]